MISSVCTCPPTYESLPILEQLYSTYHQAIYRHTYNLLHQHEEAEDITQETFVKAMHALPTLRYDDDLRAWLYKVAGNAARDVLRYKRRRQQDALPQERVFSPGPETASIDPYEQYELREELEHLMKHLHPEDAAYFFLLAQGYSIQAIAQEVGRPCATIRQRIRRARAKVQGKKLPRSEKKK